MSFTIRIKHLHKAIFKALILLVFFTFFVENTYAQRRGWRYCKRQFNSIDVPKHLLCFETGFYSRGLIGFSYYSNEEILKNHSFISTFISIGNKGLRIVEDSDLFGTLGLSYNIGGYSNYFSVGSEIKYVRLHYWKSIGWTASDAFFNGSTYGGFIGYTKFTNGLMLQARISYMRSFMNLPNEEPWFNLGRGKLSALGLGITIGWNLSFKDLDFPELF